MEGGIQAMACPRWNLVSVILFFFLFKATPMVYGSSQARGLNGELNERPATDQFLNKIPFWMLERLLLKFGKRSSRTSISVTKARRS